MAASNEGVENGAGAGARAGAAAPALGVVLAAFGFTPVTLSFDIRHELQIGNAQGGQLRDFC